MNSNVMRDRKESRSTFNLRCACEGIRGFNDQFRRAKLVPRRTLHRD